MNFKEQIKKNIINFSKTISIEEYENNFQLFQEMFSLFDEKEQAEIYTEIKSKNPNLSQFLQSKYSFDDVSHIHIKNVKKLLFNNKLDKIQDLIISKTVSPSLFLDLLSEKEGFNLILQNLSEYSFSRHQEALFLIETLLNLDKKHLIPKIESFISEQALHKISPTLKFLNKIFDSNLEFSEKFYISTLKLYRNTDFRQSYLSLLFENNFLIKNHTDLLLKNTEYLNDFILEAEDRLKSVHPSIHDINNKSKNFYLNLGNIEKTYIQNYNNQVKFIESLSNNHEKLQNIHDNKPVLNNFRVNYILHNITKLLSIKYSSDMNSEYLLDLDLHIQNQKEIKKLIITNESFKKEIYKSINHDSSSDEKFSKKSYLELICLIAEENNTSSNILYNKILKSSYQNLFNLELNLKFKDHFLKHVTQIFKNINDSKIDYYKRILLNLIEIYPNNINEFLDKMPKEKIEELITYYKDKDSKSSQLVFSCLLQYNLDNSLTKTTSNLKIKI